MRIIRENAILLSVICATILIVVIALRIDERNRIKNGVGTYRVSPEHSISITEDPGDSLILDSGEILEVEVEMPITDTTPIDTDEEIGDVVSAESYLVGDLQSGEIYLQKDANTILPIASISKLFTALTAEALVSSSTVIKITDEMLTPYGTTTGIVKNAEFTLDELMYPLLLESSNDVAFALAQSHGYDEFINYMNGFAIEVGLLDSSFSDTSGLDARNVSTAKDLFTFARYLYTDRPDILKMSKLDEYTALSYTYKNTNPFVKDPHFIGGKTGRTDAAREAMLSLFEFNINGVYRPIAVIVLRSDFGYRQIDSALLIKMFLDTI